MSSREDQEQYGEAMGLIDRGLDSLISAEAALSRYYNEPHTLGASLRLVLDIHEDQANSPEAMSSANIAAEVETLDDLLDALKIRHVNLSVELRRRADESP